MPQPPQGSGAGAAFKWGGLFGVVAGIVSLVQVLVSAAAVNANLSSIQSFAQGFQTYENCINSANDPSTCVAPAGDSGIAGVFLAFYGTCLVIFLLTLVVYTLAARFAARETARRGPAIWAAVIAAGLGSVLYFIFGVISIVITGRTGLLIGLGPEVLPQADAATAGAWTAVLIIYTVIADAIALALTLGIAALVGMLGAALGLRAAPSAGASGSPYPPAYPPTYPPAYPAAYPPPSAPPYAGQPAYPPSSSAIAPPPQSPPPVVPPPTQDYTLPAQYPPLPSDYEPPTTPGGNTGNA